MIHSSENAKNVAEMNLQKMVSATDTSQNYRQGATEFDQNLPPDSKKANLENTENAENTISNDQNSRNSPYENNYFQKQMPNKYPDFVYHQPVSYRLVFSLYSFFWLISNM